MSLNNFFSMGGYAAYVWSAYGISFIILFLNIFLAVRNERKTMNELKKRLIDYLLSEEFFDRKKLHLEDFEKKFRNIINLIITNAPIKMIYKNKNEAEIVLMFNEIINEIKKIELRKKIDFLEDKVSINLDETLYSELLLLRNQLKRG